MTSSSWSHPAAIAIAFVISGAPINRLPHCTRLPSFLSATLNVAPAAIPTTFVKSGGTFVCPNEFEPQQTTVPLFFKAMVGHESQGQFTKRAEIGFSEKISSGSGSAIR